MKREISEIRPFEEQFEVFHLPSVRIIGKEARSGGALGNTAPALWDSVYSSGAYETLKALPQIIPDCLFGWTCEYDKESDTFIYMVCAMTPADTPVPDGFTFRDIPESACAKGLFGGSVAENIELSKSHGYEPNWEPYGWNAELYLDAEEANPPRSDCTPWHWLTPVKNIEQ